MEKQPLLNAYVNNFNMSEAIWTIETLIAAKKKSYVVAINTDVVVKMENDSDLKRIVNTANITLVDGKPLQWIAKWQKRPVRAKVSGSDLVPLLCAKAAEKGYSVFILGGKKGVPEQAQRVLEQKHPSIKIVGIYSPTIGFERNKSEINYVNEVISQARPDLLIVCLGCPKQEKFIHENIEKYAATVSICAGATVDFLAGNVMRAPEWMSNIGLEWFFRFLQEPKRMFRRYFVDNLKIIKLLWKYQQKTIR